MNGKKLRLYLKLQGFAQLKLLKQENIGFENPFMWVYCNLLP